jgi:hypothetical protein
MRSKGVPIDRPLIKETMSLAFYLMFFMLRLPQADSSICACLIFSPKIREDIRISRLPVSIFDTSGKLTAEIVDTVRKFTSSILERSCNGTTGRLGYLEVK